MISRIIDGAALCMLVGCAFLLYCFLNPPEKAAAPEALYYSLGRLSR